MVYKEFVTVIFVVRNQEKLLDNLLFKCEKLMGSLVQDFEIIIVDNCSTDNSVESLKKHTGPDGVSNLIVLALTNCVDEDVASWAGLENSLGDYVVVMDPATDDIGFLPNMLDVGSSGADVVFAKNLNKSRQGILYHLADIVFNKLYNFFTGIHIAEDAPRYRLLSRNVVNYVLQHSQPAVSYRYLPVTGGFQRKTLEYSAEPAVQITKRLSVAIDRGLRLLISTTRAPMRIVTALSLFGAAANILYSFYVIAIVFLKSDVAPGWVSLSLQQSGMFFLISLVLFVLGEYILHMSSLSNSGPLYYVGRELKSTKMTSREKLNVEVVTFNKSQTHTLSSE